MDTYALTNDLVSFFLQLFYLLFVVTETMTDKRLVIELMSMNWSNPSLDISIDSHHLHQFSVEAYNRSETKGNVECVGTGGDE